MRKNPHIESIEKTRALMREQQKQEREVKNAVAVWGGADPKLLAKAVSAEMRLAKAKEEELRRENERLEMLVPLLESAAELGLTAVSQLAKHCGCTVHDIKKMYDKFPDLKEKVATLAEQPKINAKKAIAKQLKIAAKTDEFNPAIAKVAIDYLKTRQDEDFKGGDISVFAPTSITFVGVSANAQQPKEIINVGTEHTDA